MRKLLVLFVFLFTVFFSYAVVAQELGSLRKGYEISFPEKIQSPLGPPLAPGTYTIGTGGYFQTIDSAFNKISADGIAGEIVLELIDNLYTAPKTLYGYLLNGPIPGSSSRVIIRPAVNNNVVIESSGGSAFTFINTNYVTVDGVSLTGATTLTFHTIQDTTYQWNDGIDFIFNSDHNVIQNINFIDEDYNRGGGGIGFWNPSASAFACDSNLAQNNFIKASGIAIYVAAFDNSSVRPKGNIIRGNIIGSETDSLIGYGIQVEVCQNTIIEKNIIQNVRYFNRPDVGSIRGINSYNGSGDIIRDNIVHNIAASGDWGSTGILLSGESGYLGNNNQVYNNMVYDITSTSNWPTSRVCGIQMWYQNNPKIYYNSVNLSGNGSNSLGSAALFLYYSCSNVDVRNNIFVNTRDESPYCASTIRLFSGFSTLTSNHNDLYYNPNQYNCLVRNGSADYHTLVEWQAVGKDINSINEMPYFASPDLHLDWYNYTLLDGHATPIAGITTDYDGDARNTTTPDIGADEGMILPVELTSFTAKALDQKVILKWTTATELNNNGFEVQRSVAESDFVTIGFVKGEGTTTSQREYSYIDKDLNDGKHFYRLRQVDYNGSYEYSDVIEVDVRSLNDYTLEQNYPNPFNPSSTIGYVLKERTTAKLILLNAIGEEVAVLVNEEQDKGFQKVDFNAGTLVSGVYFYRLQAGD